MFLHMTFDWQFILSSRIFSNHYSLHSYTSVNNSNSCLFDCDSFPFAKMLKCRWLLLPNDINVKFRIKSEKNNFWSLRATQNEVQMLHVWFFILFRCAISKYVEQCILLKCNLIRKHTLKWNWIGFASRMFFVKQNEHRNDFKKQSHVDHAATCSCVKSQHGEKTREKFLSLAIWSRMLL